LDPSTLTPKVLLRTRFFQVIIGNDVHFHHSVMFVSQDSPPPSFSFTP
jgi:hypothetical protein